MKVRDIITESQDSFQQAADQYFRDEQLGMADRTAFNNWVRLARDKSGKPYTDFGKAMIAYQTHQASQAKQQSAQQPAQQPKAYSDKFRGNQYTGGIPGSAGKIKKAYDTGGRLAQRAASKLSAISNFDLKNVGRV